MRRRGGLASHLGLRWTCRNAAPLAMGRVGMRPAGVDYFAGDVRATVIVLHSQRLKTQPTAIGVAILTILVTPDRRPAVGGVDGKVESCIRGFRHVVFMCHQPMAPWSTALDHADGERVPIWGICSAGDLSCRFGYRGE